MNYNLPRVRISCATVFFLFFALRADLPAATDVLVEDEIGNPIEDAYTELEYFLPRTNTLESKTATVTARTDDNGAVRISPASENLAGGRASKNGFYASTLGKTRVASAEKDSQIRFVLRKVGQPTSLYARKIVHKRIPAVEQQIGFDFQRGDWVAPHGKGEVADFYFRLSRSFKSAEEAFDSELKLSFPNPSDGLVRDSSSNVGSTMRMTRLAPLEGYLTSHTERNYRASSKSMIVTTRDEDANYFFRTRTSGAPGNVVSGHYTKLQGGIRYGVIGSDTAVVSFTYYFNPTPSDRNLEFDVRSNLFGQLSWQERVEAP